MDAEKLKVRSEGAEWIDPASGKEWTIQGNDQLTVYQS